MDDGADQRQRAIGHAHLVADLVTHGRSSLLNVSRGDDLAADEPAYCKNHHSENEHDVAGEDGVLCESGDGHENAGEQRIGNDEGDHGFFIAEEKIPRDLHAAGEKRHGCSDREIEPDHLISGHEIRFDGADDEADHHADGKAKHADDEIEQIFAVDGGFFFHWQRRSKLAPAKLLVHIDGRCAHDAKHHGADDHGDPWIDNDRHAHADDSVCHKNEHERCAHEIKIFQKQAFHFISLLSRTSA